MTAAHTITLWHHKFSDDDGDDRRHWVALDEMDRARAASIKIESKRRRFITGHGLLRTLLSQIVNAPPQHLKIAKTRHGKPYLVEFPELAFNLSHTVGSMVIAVGRNCQLGADIETCKPRTSLPALVERCFAKIEADWWRSLPETEKVREFYRFWTRKEAFVKATGLGIALGLNQCVVNPDNPSAWLHVPACCGLASSWHTREIALNEEVCTALVADQAIEKVELILI